MKKHLINSPAMSDEEFKEINSCQHGDYDVNMVFKERKTNMNNVRINLAPLFKTVGFLLTHKKVKYTADDGRIITYYLNKNKEKDGPYTETVDDKIVVDEVYKNGIKQ
jgi:hypothetical protein